MTEPTAKEVADLQAVLDPRNGRMDNGCILVHEKVLQRSLDTIAAQQSRIEALEKVWQWVSVEEKLPRIVTSSSETLKTELVLAVDEKGRMAVGCFTILINGGGNFISAKPIGSPAYWMPLPPAPQGSP
jgi:hypothetical protein